MDISSEIQSPKRKLEESIDDKRSDKRLCSGIIAETKSLNNLNDSINITNLVTVDCTNNLEKNDELNDIATDTNAQLCYKSNVNEEEEILEQSSICSTKQNIENKNVELNKGTILDSNKKIESIQDQNVNSDDSFNAVPEHENENENENVNVNVNVNSSNNDANNDTSTISLPFIPRQKCKYGRQCYRVNTEHKATFSHPGDSDYDLPDVRPECPYGLSCYRTNPQHKLYYKHTQTHNTRQRHVNINRASPENFSDFDNSMEESVDESDYDPSFIDDDSIDEFESDFDDEKD